jgi:hypothetical protein
VAAGAAPSTVATAADRRDQPGTTHHEAGTLRMGTDPATSATDPDCRLHCVNNAYAAGPSLFPRTGSPNPMLSGVALARRLAVHLSDTTPYVAEAGYQVLFNGIDAGRWRFAGRGDVALIDGALVTEPADGLGLSWCSTPTPPDFTLRLQFRLTRPDDNSGVFVRFPDPTSKGYDNPAWVPVHFGLEAQIDDLARDDGADMHHTGACYGIPDPAFVRLPARPPGQWNDYEITCQGQTYTITLNGTQTTRVVNTNPQRGRPGAPAAPSFIGVQAHTGHVAFRHIRITAL